MAKYTSKINKIRTFALSLIFIGIAIMYGGLFLKDLPILMVILMILGFLCIIGSAVVYFLIGMLSMKAVQVICPSTLDKTLEGKEFNELYNRKRNLN